MLPAFVNTGFQVLFHSPPGVLFTFPSRYSFTIGHQVVFSLGEWTPLLPTGLLVSCGTLDLNLVRSLSSYGTLTLFRPAFQPCSASARSRFRRSATPPVRRLSVWAPSLSLAATQEIDVSFSSSGYLDVSVHRVPPV